MNLNNIIPSFVGLSLGYVYTEAKNKEDEVHQGKNYYIASFYQIEQASTLMDLISKINSICPKHVLRIPIAIACNLSILVTLPIFLISATVKHDHYQTFALQYNQVESRYKLISLPQELGPRTVHAMKFLSQHAGDILRVAMLTASVAIILLGNAAYGASVLIMLGYEIVDHQGWIPRKISLFMETYMPTLSMMGILVGGMFISRVYSALCLTSCLSSTFNRFIQQKIDLLVRRYFPIQIPGPTLVEIDAPLIKNANLSFNEINTILNEDNFLNEEDDDEISGSQNQNNKYEINPPSYSYEITSSISLPKNNDFRQYLILFDKIDWIKNFNLVKLKLKIDDRFIDFVRGELKKEHPDLTRPTTREFFDNYIAELASKNKVSVENYLTSWLREQMVYFTNIIQGKQRAEGSQQDVDEAIDFCSELLPFLTSSSLTSIEQEDILLALAVEAGNYCGRGIRRASYAILQEMIETKVLKDPNLDPVKKYEMQIFQGLQNKRYEYIQKLYEVGTTILSISKDISQDVHGFDMYFKYLQLGIFPQTHYERAKMGLSGLVGWYSYSVVRFIMYKAYQSELDETVKIIIETNGKANFGIYISQIIHANTSLSKTEKDDLEEKFTECNDNKWTIEDTQKKFRHLMLVQMGILRPAATS